MKRRTHICGRLRRSGQPAARVGGWTLVEMVTVMVIMSIIGLVVSYVIIESTKTYARTVPAMDASYKAELAANRMKREIRDMKATSTVSTMTSSALTFDDSSSTTIAYSLSGTDLTRNGDLLASGVSSLAFSYWQSDGTSASSASDLHLIELDMTVVTGSEPYRLQVAAFPRVLSP